MKANLIMPLVVPGALQATRNFLSQLRDVLRHGPVPPALASRLLQLQQRSHTQTKRTHGTWARRAVNSLRRNLFSKSVGAGALLGRPDGTPTMQHRLDTRLTRCTRWSSLGKGIEVCHVGQQKDREGMGCRRRPAVLQRPVGSAACLLGALPAVP